jgi:hypothetical protein
MQEIRTTEAVKGDETISSLAMVAKDSEHFTLAVFDLYFCTNVEVQMYILIYSIQQSDM